MGSGDETESSRRLLRNGGGAEKPKPRRKRHVHWKPIAVVLVAVVVVAAVMVLKPWEAESGDGEPTDEYVWVQYTASFKLLSTSDNEPANFSIGFPYPYFKPDPNEVPETVTPETPEAIQVSNMWVIDLSPKLLENFQLTFTSSGDVENRPPPLFEPMGENYVEKGIFTGDNRFYVPELNLTAYNIYPDDRVTIKAQLLVSSENLRKLTMVNGYFHQVKGHEDNAVIWVQQETGVLTLEISVEINRKNDALATIEKWVGAGTLPEPGIATLRRTE